MDNKENFHIYLNSKDQTDHVLKEASSYEKYIILMNESLQIENKKLCKDISEKSHEMQNLEEEIERLESSKTYMRGFLNNIVILNRLYKKNSDEYINIKKIYISHFKSKYDYSKKLCHYIQVVLMVLIALIYQINIINIYQIIFLTLLCSGFHMFLNEIISYLLLPNIDNNMVNIKQNDSEILNINKGQDILHEYIEIM
jgi:hypothetical protein